MHQFIQKPLAALYTVAGLLMAGPALAQSGEAVAAAVVEDNPYGLSALWSQGDLVAKGTLLILVITDCP